MGIAPTVPYSLTALLLVLNLIQAETRKAHGFSPEIADLAALVLLHGVERAHTPVLLEPHAVSEVVLSRRLRGAGQK